MFPNQIADIYSMYSNEYEIIIRFLIERLPHLETVRCYSTTRPTDSQSKPGLHPRNEAKLSFSPNACTDTSSGREKDGYEKEMDKSPPRSGQFVGRFHMRRRYMLTVCWFTSSRRGKIYHLELYILLSREDRKTFPHFSTLVHKHGNSVN